MSRPQLLTIDGVRPSPQLAAPRIRPQKEVAAAQHRPARNQPRPFQVAPQQSTRHGLWQRLQLPVLLCAGMVVGFLVQSLVFGLVAITLYAVLSVIYRIPSRITFMLAFMALVTVAVLLVVRPGAALAGTFATYTFLLLVVGVIALAIEARPPKRRKRLKRPTRG